jgi:hypothetical protein
MGQNSIDIAISTGMRGRKSTKNTRLTSRGEEGGEREKEGERKTEKEQEKTRKLKADVSHQDESHTLYRSMAYGVKD